MTVGELIKRLERLPKKWEVVLSKDEEGNGFSPLYAADVGDWNDVEHEWESEEEANSNSVCLWP